MLNLQRAIRYSFSDGTPWRAAYVALVFGTILNLINQGDAILGAVSINWTKIFLTYVVPYAVSTLRRCLLSNVETTHMSVAAADDQHYQVLAHRESNGARWAERHPGASRR
jgi:hypothetical protein